MISVTRLTHRFGPRAALDEVSFTVAKGEFAFLTGPSGAGKTTLLRLLHADIPLSEGRITIAGHDLTALRPRDLPVLRADVAVIFQDFKVLPKASVAQNVQLPLEVRGMDRESIQRRVEAALTALGIAPLAAQPCETLSGGEQQRVAIARAMVGSPRVILADEPTGNLDWDMAARLMDVFKQFHAHGATILMATHNREIVRATPQARILRLEAGRLTGGRGEPGWRAAP